MSAPSQSEVGGGTLGGSGGGYGGGGGGGGAERKQGRARTAMLCKTRRPGSAGAALGSSGVGEHVDQVGGTGVGCVLMYCTAVVV